MFRVKRRIAFFGGTFDPIHAGHLAMAQAALEHLGLHRVYFVPARRNPFKEDGPQVDDEDRVEMINQAIAGHPHFGIWEGELDREGPSYTLDSIRYIERVYPNSHLFWIIGYDQLAGLRNWYGIDQLVFKIGFILVARPGYTLAWPAIPGLTIYPVNNRMLDISSTGIRLKLAQGQQVGDELPPVVADYIRENGLYA